MIQRYHAYGTYAGDDGTFVDYNDHAAALAAKDAEIERLRTGDTCARACEGMAFRIMYQQEKARAERAEANAANWEEQANDRVSDWDEVRAERDALKLRLAAVEDMNAACNADFSRLRAERAEAEAAGLRADAERWRAVSAMMTHEHRGDAVGWTLSVLLPGDDPDAAIDAARGEQA